MPRKSGRSFRKAEFSVSVESVSRCASDIFSWTKRVLVFFFFIREVLYQFRYKLGQKFFPHLFYFIFFFK